MFKLLSEIATTVSISRWYPPLSPELWALVNSVCLRLPNTRTSDVQCHTQLFTWVLGIRTQVLMLMRQALWAISLTFSFSFPCFTCFLCVYAARVKVVMVSSQPAGSQGPGREEETAKRRSRALFIHKHRPPPKKGTVWCPLPCWLNILPGCRWPGLRRKQLGASMGGFILPGLPSCCLGRAPSLKSPACIERCAWWGLPLGCISAMSLFFPYTCQFLLGEGKEKCQNKLERKEH